MKKKRKWFETKKDVFKTVRAILEILSIILLVIAVIRALFFFTEFKPYDEFDDSVVTGEDHGFLALSYLGVDREGSDTLIATGRLDQELAVLKQLGYVTISQKDICDYYYDGKPLPEKALYLMFEDGRKDTTMFAEKLLEKYNFKATIMTYASNLEEANNTFLSPKDIKKIEETGYCELGTNGYRLAYINAYDRYDRYLGQLTAREYVVLRPFLRRDYNHYLMDFLRDENRIPMESSAEMRDRIDFDYDKMREVYSEKFGRVPLAYVLMQANTGRFGDNDKVSDQNRENMEALFKVNFNREGYSINRSDDDEYDLTRMQPQAYWYVNHLLMRIRDDMDEDEKKWIRFVTGDKKRAESWKVTSGAAEFAKNNIALTSLPDGYGRMHLDKEMKIPEDICLFATLKGNVLGTQTICLRSDEKAENALKVMIRDNHLIIREAAGGNYKDLLDFDMHELTDEDERVSIEEDNAKAYENELAARSRFSEDMKEGIIYFYERLNAKIKNSREVVTYEDGGEEYLADFDINDKGDRSIQVLLKDNKITVLVDEKLVIDRLETNVKADSAKDMLTLECGVPDEDYSQRNLADDVYDGAFEDLSLMAVNKDAGDIHDQFIRNELRRNDPALSEIYDNSLKGFELFEEKWKRFWAVVIDWFIANL